MEVGQRLVCTVAGLLMLSSSAICAEKDFPGVGDRDWAWWRGPSLNNVSSDQAMVTEWSDTRNVIWKAPVPGRGHASPIVVGSRIFLATADEEKQIQSVLCYERSSGKLLWKKDLHEGGFDGRVHNKNTRASSTLACDGKHVFAVFFNKGTIWATALSLEGNQVWQKKIGDFVSHWGYSASPALYKSLVIIASDHKGGGVLVGLDRESGKVRWETPRPKVPNYASPIVLHVAGKDQVFLAGGDKVVSYDPMTGKELWSVKGTSVECVSTVVSEGDLVYACGGFPAKETLCIRADGSGKVLWRAPVADYVPSLLVWKGYVYSVLDNGTAICWKADTGEEMWKKRIGGGFSASPMLVGDLIYMPSESGKMVIFRANPKEFELVAENQLGKGAFASPVVCDGRMYLRVVTTTTGDWQEMLYCIGK